MADIFYTQCSTTIAVVTIIAAILPITVISWMPNDERLLQQLLWIILGMTDSSCTSDVWRLFQWLLWFLLCGSFDTHLMLDERLLQQFLPWRTFLFHPILDERLLQWLLWMVLATTNILAYPMLNDRLLQWLLWMVLATTNILAYPIIEDCFNGCYSSCYAVHLLHNRCLANDCFLDGSCYGGHSCIPNARRKTIATILATTYISVSPNSRRPAVEMVARVLAMTDIFYTPDARRTGRGRGDRPRGGTSGDGPVSWWWGGWCTPHCVEWSDPPPAPGDTQIQRQAWIVMNKWMRTNKWKNNDE